MESVIRVLVVDDDALVRSVYVDVLRGAGFDVMDHAEARGLDAALVEHQPHVVVMDLDLRRQQGERILLEAVRICGDALRPLSRIVLVSGLDEHEIAYRGRVVPGAVGVSKMQPIADLVAACRIEA